MHYWRACDKKIQLFSMKVKLKGIQKVRHNFKWHNFKHHHHPGKAFPIINVATGLKELSNIFSMDDG